MALFFWHRAEHDSVAFGLMGVALYRRLKQALPRYDAERQGRLAEQAKHLENLVTKLVDECQAGSAVSRSDSFACWLGLRSGHLLSHFSKACPTQWLIFSNY